MSIGNPPEGTSLFKAAFMSCFSAPWGYFTGSPAGHFANAVSREAFQAAGAYREACQALAGAAAESGSPASAQAVTTSVRERCTCSNATVRAVGWRRS